MQHQQHRGGAPSRRLMLLLTTASFVVATARTPDRPRGGIEDNRPVEYIERLRLEDLTRTLRCDLPRYTVANVPPLAGQRQPVVVTGWHNHVGAERWAQPDFLRTFGDFPQIMKNAIVRPIFDRDGRPVVISTREYVTVMNESRHSVLLFTNEKENPVFMDAVQANYSTPAFVQHIDGFQVFSGATTAASHAMHFHGESWLGQITGRKVWWFMPPYDTNTKVRAPKVNACQFLQDPSLAPAGATVCLQRPTEIIWFPSKWLHGTCSLDDWSLGVGAQVGEVSVPGLSVPRPPHPAG